MSESEATIFVVDDDPGVRQSLEMLIRAIGQSVETYASAGEFLDAYTSERPGCLVLDLRMPGMSGLELQEELGSRGSNLPVIFITAHGDVPTAVDAVKGGAIDFIQKPFRDQDLIEKIELALEQNERALEETAERGDVQARVASLTSRERQVMDIVVDGKTNKAMATELRLSERTVEIHRARVMSKMGAESLADLVKMALRARGDGSPPAG
ncbi:MAG: response regulator [Gemmatimonadota bacterium]|nr:response regulator [Candidatus Palauibacterales bacterium]